MTKGRFVVCLMIRYEQVRMIVTLSRSRTTRVKDPGIRRDDKGEIRYVFGALYGPAFAGMTKGRFVMCSVLSTGRPSPG